MNKAIVQSANMTLGFTLLSILLILACVGAIWTPYSVTTIDSTARLLSPSLLHLLGTDHYGRDTLSLIMAGAANAFFVGGLSVSLGSLIGVVLGLIAASSSNGRPLQKFLDSIIMRGSDIIFAFPVLISALLLVNNIGSGMVTAVLAIATFNIPVFARLSRNISRQVWIQEFVTAARAVGRNPWQITLRHILPSARGPLIVQASTQFGLAILADATLSYLGVGVQPPSVSWGRMLADAQTFLYISPAQAITPGIMITLAVLGANLLGTGLSDFLSLKLQQE
ncbi:MAG: ABC transporter permease [Alphaproteobacteria bacterium]